MKHLSSLILCSLLLSIAGIAAADSTVVSPAACHLAGGVTTGLTYGMGHVTNTSGGNLSIFCPIIRDSTSNINGLRSVQVAVTDPTGTLKCDVGAVDRAGNILKVVTLTTPGTGSRIIDFGSSLNVSADRGHYQVICSVPNGAAIHSIYYDE